MPWDYRDEDLTTFCNWCHHEFHKHNQIPVYSEDLLNQLNDTPGKRCNDAGRFPESEHVSKGICFRCDGARYEELIMD